MSKLKPHLVWRSYFSVMNGLGPLVESTLSDGWLKWIDPKPTDAAELDRLSAAIRLLLHWAQISTVKGSERIDLLKGGEVVEARTKKLQAAIDALNGLPEDILGLPQIAWASHCLLNLAEGHLSVLDDIAGRSQKRGRGRPKAEDKILLAQGTASLLEDHGKVASSGPTGTITGLARWIWSEVVEDPGDLESWAETVGRTVGRARFRASSLNAQN